MLCIFRDDADVICFARNDAGPILKELYTTMSETFTEFDHQCMKRAIELARQAELLGEVPVGAVVVHDNKIIAEAHNEMITNCDPTGHAEIVALRKAANVLGNYRLNDCELYVTLEPCGMCAGAMVHARVKRLVYAAKDYKTGAAGTVFNIVSHEKLNHKVDVQKGLLAQECSKMLKDFFKAKRVKATEALSQE